MEVNNQKIEVEDKYYYRLTASLFIAIIALFSFSAIWSPHGGGSIIVPSFVLSIPIYIIVGFLILKFNNQLKAKKGKSFVTSICSVVGYMFVTFIPIYIIQIYISTNIFYIN